MQPLQQFQRRYLRSVANPLKPTVFIGKNGITPHITAALEEALDTHELVKVRFLEFKDEKQRIAEELASQCQGECIGIIGHVAMFYRQHPDPQKLNITLPTEK